MAYKPYSYEQRPDLVDAAAHLIGDVWPEFMLNDPVANIYWERLEREFPACQFVLCEETYGPDGQDRVVAVGNSIPVWWDGDPNSLPDRGWDAVLEAGFREREMGRKPNTLSELSASVGAEYQGHGLSPLLVEQMKATAREHGFRTLIAPVRPSYKSAYPLIPAERYANWTQADGAPFDPWLRVHWRLGGKILKIAPRSMTIRAPVGQWEEWTGMRFPESGQYILPKALVPLEIDCERDEGLYVEPNIWVEHRIEY